MTILGYCNRCETQCELEKDHYCHVCYKSYCENCYFEEIYGDDLCDNCFNDMYYIKDLKTRLYEIERDVYELKNDFDDLKKQQKLLIAIHQIDTNDTITSKDKALLIQTVKDLITNKNKTTVMDDAAEMLKDLIEKMTDLKIVLDNPGFCSYDISIKD